MDSKWQRQKPKSLQSVENISYFLQLPFVSGDILLPSALIANWKLQMEHK